MKEKRIDINLAKAAFYQVIFIGFGGAFVTEVIKVYSARQEVIIGTAVATISMAIVVRRYYQKATRLSKKSKRKYHATV